MTIGRNKLTKVNYAILPILYGIYNELDTENEVEKNNKRNTE